MSPRTGGPDPTPIDGSIRQVRSPTTTTTHVSSERARRRGDGPDAGLGTGIAIGVAVGSATDDLALWLPMGVALGVAIGSDLRR